MNTPPSPLRTRYVSPLGADDNPGTQDAPWRTPGRAAAGARPGDLVLLRGGVYPLSEMIRPAAGEAGAPVVFAAAEGERAVLDAGGLVPRSFDRPRPYALEQGAFLLEGVHHVQIHGLEIVNSHWSGICVIDSQQVEIAGNTIENTFAPAIAFWDTTRRGVCREHKILGNTVRRANRRALFAGPGARWDGEAPHEAISLGGAHHFEVAWNHVHDCEKEGIDVKETSQHGVVHHNHVHHVDRQGLYADAWFGVLQEVEFHANVVHDCGSLGMAISVEDVELARGLRIHHNLFYDNHGGGIFFSRWGKDGPRREIEIHHNTVHHNGYAQSVPPGQEYSYVTGGLYLFSTNLHDLQVHDNIFSDNHGFQVGLSRRYGESAGAAAETLARQGIRIAANLIHEPGPRPRYPIRVGDDRVFARHDGNPPGDPGYADPAAGDFRRRPGSPAPTAGACGPGGLLDPWWQQDFPPRGARGLHAR